MNIFHSDRGKTIFQSETEKKNATDVLMLVNLKSKNNWFEIKAFTLATVDFSIEVVFMFTTHFALDVQSEYLKKIAVNTSEYSFTVGK